MISFLLVLYWSAEISGCFLLVSQVDQSELQENLPRDHSSHRYMCRQTSQHSAGVLCLFSVWYDVQVSVFVSAGVPSAGLSQGHGGKEVSHLQINLFCQVVLSLSKQSVSSWSTAGRASWSWTHWSCRTTRTSADSSESKFHFLIRTSVQTTFEIEFRGLM